MLIVRDSISKNNGIGLKNALPWKLKNELQYFSRKTTETTTDEYQNAVIMGRRTWESVPPKFKPFNDRLNVVISSSSSKLMDGVLHFHNVEEAITTLQKDYLNIETIWIIGGAGIYKEALEKKLCDKLYITRIKNHYDCDTFFPEFNEYDYDLIEEVDVPSKEQEENGILYEFKVYKKKRTD